MKIASIALRAKRRQALQREQSTCVAGRKLAQRAALEQRPDDMAQRARQ